MDSPAKTATLLVHSWNTQCGGCGYGGESWACSPALKGKPILGPESTECPECGAKFTVGVEKPYYSDESSFEIGHFYDDEP